jgi:hypothetical protein
MIVYSEDEVAVVDDVTVAVNGREERERNNFTELKLIKCKMQLLHHSSTQPLRRPKP